VDVVAYEAICWAARQVQRWKGVSYRSAASTPYDIKPPGGNEVERSVDSRQTARAIQTAAPSFRVELLPVGVHDADEVERGITEFAQGSDGGLIVVGPPSSIRFHRDLIVGLTARQAPFERRPTDLGACGELTERGRQSETRHNNGHRKLLQLRLKGSEFNDGDQSNQNENYQHRGLRDREGWFGLHRSQRIESRNLHEALHD